MSLSAIQKKVRRHTQQARQLQAKLQAQIAYIEKNPNSDVIVRGQDLIEAFRLINRAELLKQQAIAAVEQQGGVA